MTDERELVRLLGTRYIERTDVKAVQSADGAWRPVKCEACLAEQNRTKVALYCPHMPMKMSDFRSHLAGETTLGHYLVKPGTNTCKFFAFDLDLMKPKVDDEGNVLFQPYYGDDGEGTFPGPSAVPFNPREAWLNENHPAQEEMILELRSLADGFAENIDRRLGIPVAILDSGGKGLHVYGLTGSIPAEAAQALAVDVMEYFGCFERSKGNAFWRHRNADKGVHQYVEIEIFPKQTEVAEGGYGNLMKLPLGVNRKSGRTSRFISTRAGRNKMPTMDPIQSLEGDQPWE